ncbi:MAG: chemotaxis protein CheA [Pseudomonadota bacterium]
MDDLRETLFEECADLLEAMEAGLQRLDAGEGSEETVHAVFRAVHSIKGGAAAFGLDAVTDLAHATETVLDAVRAGALATDGALTALLLAATDHLADLVAAARDGGEADATRSAEIMMRLAAARPAVSGEDMAEFAFEPVALDLDLDEVPAVDARTVRIRFQPHAALYARGNEPTLILRALEDLGEIDVRCDPGALPTFDDLLWSDSYLVWDIALTTTADDDTIAEIFDFVRGDCALTIDPPDDRADDEAVSSADPAPIAVGPPRPTVRVDLDRVDRLIDLLGEMVTGQAMLAQAVRDAGLSPNSPLASGVDAILRLTGEMQESVMAIRAQPVGTVFRRMSRIVREAAQASGKRVSLQIEGAETEVDKTIIEHLADPLTHLLRNAVDHGLEGPEARRAAGKSEEGCIRLSARHRSGRILIEIADDGAGIDRTRVRDRAVESGLIPADARLDPGEIDALIFAPGFSTADSVSNLSGRGVGMDVVRTTIEALGGRITLRSAEGRGTEITVSLPLTLAILDGMLVEVAGQPVVLPLSVLTETLLPPPGALHPAHDGGHLLQLREALLPVRDVAATLGFRPARTTLHDGVMLIAERADGQRLALHVDVVHEQRQVVIKGLDAVAGQVPGVAAATILGDGRVALILDIEQLDRAPDRVRPPLRLVG